MLVSLGGSLKHQSMMVRESMRAQEQCFSILMSLDAKSSNKFNYDSLGSSVPPPVSVLINQTALRHRQNIICRSLPPSKNFWAKGKSNH